MMRVLLVLGAVFCVALAVVVGTRMSVDATALVVGVACGVLASVPTSLLLIWALNRRDPAGTAARPAGPGFGYQYPPVVVVNPGQGYGRPGWGQAAFPGGDDMLLPGGTRQFKVVGEAETPGRASEYRYPAAGSRDW
jgi:hypothetical protein